MIEFEVTIRQFDEKGEKTHWIYIELSAAQAHELNPGVRTSFRVRGFLDSYELRQTALLPMGDGTFIIPLNAGMRKALKKNVGEKLLARLELDTSELLISSDLLDCLTLELSAEDYFMNLPKSHQKYYSNWIESAKTIETKTKRITQAVTACSMQMGYSEMIRYFREKEKR